MTTRQPRAARARRLTSALAAMAAAVRAAAAAQESGGIIGNQRRVGALPHHRERTRLLWTARPAPAAPCTHPRSAAQTGVLRPNGARAPLADRAHPTGSAGARLAARPVSRKACRG